MNVKNSILFVILAFIASITFVSAQDVGYIPPPKDKITVLDPYTIRGLTGIDIGLITNKATADVVVLGADGKDLSDRDLNTIIHCIMVTGVTGKAVGLVKNGYEVAQIEGHDIRGITYGEYLKILKGCTLSKECFTIGIREDLILPREITRTDKILNELFKNAGSDKVKFKNGMVFKRVDLTNAEIATKYPITIVKIPLPKRLQQGGPALASK